MSDIKRTFSLGGGSAASSLRGILKEFSDSINQSISSISSAVNSHAGTSSGQTFSQPIPKPSLSTDPNNQMVSQGGGGGGAVGRFGLTANQWGNIGRGVQLFRQAMPSVPAGIEQNIIATRAGFYGYGAGSSANRYDMQQNLATRMMQGGSGINSMDASRAMMLGQQNGIGVGLSNYNQLSMSVSRMSNLNPGAGIEGAMGAFVASQKASTVNTLKFMGIMARDPNTGKPVSPENLAQQLWNKISSQRKAGTTITKDALATSLLPGGALDSLLNQVTGGDQMLRQQLETYFYAKASGAKNMSKEELTRVGLRTDLENATAKRNAEGFRGIAQTSRASAAGAEAGTQFATAVEAFGNWVDRLTGVQKLGAFGNAFSDTAGSGLNGVVGNLGIMGLLKFLLPGKATGGPVGGQNAYIVGEKGPELFVPSSNGSIVSNEQLTFKGFRADSGPVTARDFSGGILTGLGITQNKDNVAALEQWMRFEGGHFKNSAKYNPLNTTIDMPGSKSMNSVGVEAYTSLEQGIEATIKTLTGSKADARGYTAIIDALRTGSKSDILAAIDNSAWRTGKVGGSGAYKWGGSASSSSGAASGVQTAAATAAPFSAQMMAQAGYKGGASGGTTFASGAVVININGAKDAEATGKAVAAELGKLAKG